MSLIITSGASGKLRGLGRGLRGLAAAVCVVAFAVSPVHAGGEEKMPAPRFATFLARMLTYDTHLKKRVGEKLVIAILYEGTNPASVTAGLELASELKNLELIKILDLPVQTHRIAVVGAAELEKAVQADGIGAFVVSDGLEKQQALIKKVSEKGKIMTIGTSSEQVRAGFTIAVYLDHGKSKLLVNLRASKSEGVAFSSDLLGLAEVIQ